MLPEPGNLFLSILLEGAERKALEGDQLSWGAEPREQAKGDPSEGRDWELGDEGRGEKSKVKTDGTI